jgi:hypothetical protein
MGRPRGAGRRLTRVQGFCYPFLKFFKQTQPSKHFNVPERCGAMTMECPPQLFTRLGHLARTH